MKTCPTEVAIARVLIIVSQLVLLYYSFKSNTPEVGSFALMLIGVVLSQWRKEYVEAINLIQETKERNETNGKEDHKG